MYNRDYKFKRAHNPGPKMQSKLITPAVDNILRNIQPHNQDELLHTPTAPKYPSYLGGARSFMGARNRKDAMDTRINYGNNVPDIFEYVTPWSVIYPGQNHQSTNTAVIIKKYRIAFLMHGSADWVVQDLYPTDDTSHGMLNLPFVNNLATDLPATKTYTTDGMQYNFNEEKSPIHCWQKGRIQIPDYKLLRCIYVEVNHKLGIIDDTKPDDRNNSNFLINVSCDYYFSATESFAKIPPLAISSRFVKVQNYDTKTNAAAIEGLAQIYRTSAYTGSVLLPMNDFLSSNIDTLST